MASSGTYFAGKDGSATLGGVTQPSTKWEVRISAQKVRVTNAKSPTSGDGSKWDEWLASFSGATLTIDCVGDPTLARPTTGAEMAVVLGIGGGYTISAQMILDESRHFTDRDNAYMISYQGTITGPPTFA